MARPRWRRAALSAPPHQGQRTPNHQASTRGFRSRDDNPVQRIAHTRREKGPVTQGVELFDGVVGIVGHKQGPILIEGQPEGRIQTAGGKDRASP